MFKISRKYIPYSPATDTMRGVIRCPHNRMYKTNFKSLSVSPDKMSLSLDSPTVTLSSDKLCTIYVVCSFSRYATSRNQIWKILIPMLYNAMYMLQVQYVDIFTDKVQDSTVYDHMTGTVTPLPAHTLYS